MTTTVTAMHAAGRGPIKRQLHQRTLAHGTRVAVVHDPSVRNASIVLAVPVGMRDESPGEEGMMHLLEHMIYQDSMAMTAEQRQAEVQQGGGTLGGHTHMDYTEFFETAPADRFPEMLGRLVEQVFRPALNQDQLAGQIRAVSTERAHRLALAPGGALPWPHLSGRYWQDHANSHDGSGDSDLSERATTEMLSQIHRLHYRPAGAVLVALAPLNPQLNLQLLCDAFTDFDTGCATKRSTIEAVARGNVSEVLMVSGLAAPRQLSATGTESTHEIHPGLIGDLVAAEVLSMQEGLDASAGMFGPGDLVNDDLFILVDDTGLGIAPQARFRALHVTDDDTLLHAAQRALFRAERLTHDDERLVRTIARDVLLRGTPDFATSLVSELAALSMDVQQLRILIQDSANRLATQDTACLSIIPIEEKQP